MHMDEKILPEAIKLTHVTSASWLGRVVTLPALVPSALTGEFLPW